MAVSNGRLATSELTRIPARHYTHAEPTYLRADAAESFLRVAALYEARYGKPMRSISLYRTYQRQVEIFLQRYVKRPSGITRKQHRTDRIWNGRVWKLRSGFAVSATPGLSNHGYGLAMDLTDGLNVRTSEKHRWWASIARDHGWTIRYDIGEPWHAEYNPAHDKHRGTTPKLDHAAAAMTAAPTPQEDDMTPDQDRALAEVFAASKRHSQILESLDQTISGDGRARRADDRVLGFLQQRHGGDGTPARAFDNLDGGYLLGRVSGQLAGLTEAVQQLAAGRDIDPAAITDAARAGAVQGVTDALQAITADVTLTVAKEE